MQDRMGEEQYKSDNELRDKMRQQMMREYPAAGLAELAGNGNVLLGAKLQDLASYKPRKEAPVR